MKAKSTLLFLSFMALLFNNSACANTSGKDNNESNVSVKNYTTESFEKIETEIVGAIFFTQSDNFTVRAEGKQKEIDNLIVLFEEGKLKLKTTNKRQKGKNNLKVYITAPNLVKIDHEGVGTFTLKDKVTFANLKIDYEGVGNLVADELICDTLKVEYEGVGNIKIKGAAEYAEYKSEGVGNISAEDFNVGNLIVRASGVGNVKCRANKTIEIYSNGVGGVTYWGKPEVKKLIKDGVGKVKSAK